MDGGMVSSGVQRLCNLTATPVITNILYLCVTWLLSLDGIHIVSRLRTCIYAPSLHMYIRNYS
jgi:hypothetical protein